MIREVLAHIGEIEHLKIYKDANGRCRGFAYVTLKTKEAFSLALTSKFFIFDKMIKVEPYLASKSDLTKKDELMEKHRICVLNIPASLRNEKF